MYDHWTWGTGRAGEFGIIVVSRVREPAESVFSIRPRGDRRGVFYVVRFDGGGSVENKVESDRDGCFREVCESPCFGSAVGGARTGWGLLQGVWGTNWRVGQPDLELELVGCIPVC
jgi:hypothetical protein